MANVSLKQISQFKWQINPVGKMRVPAVVFASDRLIKHIDEKTISQVTNVATLPGVVKASFAMPDAHMGYGFPIGGVAAFDPEKGGIVSGGGVGFDIACGVRTLHTGLTEDDLISIKEELAKSLFRKVPAGVGSTGKIKLGAKNIDDMLTGGAVWAVEQGFGSSEDLEFIEEKGQMPSAIQNKVSDHAKKRQLDEMGTLGSGNHYLEVQKVEEIYDEKIAAVFGLKLGDIKVSIHCGSRALGHQIGTDYLKQMANQARSHGIELPDRELACAPINSALGQSYLGAMRCGVNCAMGNRQIITALVREAFADVISKAELKLLYDVSHNTAKFEQHNVGGLTRRLLVHRKGATRALGSGSMELPAAYRKTGQPVLIGGTMGTASYILAGTGESMSLAFGSACHGAGRCMSRRGAMKQWQGGEIVRNLADKNIIIKSKTMHSIAEEAPAAYKDVDAVVEATHKIGLAKKVAKLVPLICVKG